MTSDKQSTEDTDTTNPENARLIYQTAIALWTYTGEQYWARFNAMLVANSIVVAVFGIVLISTLPPLLYALTVLSLSVVGLLLCYVWFSLTQRPLDYKEYYIRSARESEDILTSQSK